MQGFAFCPIRPPQQDSNQPHPVGAGGGCALDVGSTSQRQPKLVATARRSRHLRLRQPQNPRVRTESVSPNHKTPTKTPANYKVQRCSCIASAGAGCLRVRMLPGALSSLRRASASTVRWGSISAQRRRRRRHCEERPDGSTVCGRKNSGPTEAFRHRSVRIAKFYSPEPLAGPGGCEPRRWACIREPSTPWW